MNIAKRILLCAFIMLLSSSLLYAEIIVTPTSIDSGTKESRKAEGRAAITVPSELTTVPVIPSEEVAEQCEKMKNESNKADIEKTQDRLIGTCRNSTWR